MNVLFMSLGTLYNLKDSSVHLDILKRIASEHEVWLLCKNENKPTEFIDELGIHVLRVRTGEMKKVGIIQKGINTLKLESQFKKAIKKYLSHITFDLVIYTTPPITFAAAVKYVKERDNAKTYLMLKDIFPQNAVDIGMLKTKGINGVFYRYFRKKEKQLYKLSDRIGCMSPANMEYVLRNNPEINKEKVEICPNISVVQDKSITLEEKKYVRKIYGVPFNKKVFIYGGNLGKPQGIPFLLQCLKQCMFNEKVFFIIIGQGTEYDSIRNFIDSNQIRNCMLMKSIQKDDFERLVSACDVGLLFLDHRFTIPNFPARLLSYMKCRLPVLAATDPNTDVGKVIVDGQFGWWCESNDCLEYKKIIDELISIPEQTMKEKGDKSFNYLKDKFNPDIAYNIIFKKNKEV